jgi:peptide/nickel transport system permease protein
MHALPGDPVLAQGGSHLSLEEITRRRHDLGLDRSKFIQLFDYLRNIATLQLGYSMVDGRKVSQIILEDGSVTLSLLVFVFILICLLIIILMPLIYKMLNTMYDRFFLIVGTIVYTVPIFVFALLLQKLLAPLGIPVNSYTSVGESVGITPHTHIFILDTLLDGNLIAFFDILGHLALPASLLALVLLGNFVRLIRDSMLAIANSEYVTAAKARGINRATILKRYIVKNLLPVMLNFTAMQFVILIGGAVLTETVFNLPGIGSKLVYYINNRDYNAVEGIVLFIGCSIVLTSFIMSMINILINPKIRQAVIQRKIKYDPTEENLV